jgi:hypothetical protein
MEELTSLTAEVDLKGERGDERSTVRVRVRGFPRFHVAEGRTRSDHESLAAVEYRLREGSEFWRGAKALEVSIS